MVGDWRRGKLAQPSGAGSPGREPERTRRETCPAFRIRILSLAWRQMSCATRLPCSSSPCSCPTRAQSGNRPPFHCQDLQMGKKPVLCSNKHHAERAQPGAASYFISPQPIRVMPTRAGFFPRRAFGAHGRVRLVGPGRARSIPGPAFMRKWQVTGGLPCRLHRCGHGPRRRPASGWRPSQEAGSSCSYPPSRSARPSRPARPPASDLDDCLQTRARPFRTSGRLLPWMIWQRLEAPGGVFGTS